MNGPTKKRIISPRPQMTKHQSFTPTTYTFQRVPVSEQQMRRYSQIPPKLQQLQIKTLSKPLSRQSRLTNFKSDYPLNRKRNLTPNSKSINIAQFQARFRQIQTILNKKNQTLISQNEFLKQQIKKLYQRQNKHKCSIKKLKQQVKFLKIQCQIYQGRYAQLKEYITQVINRMSLTNINQNNYNQMVQSCSKDLLQKLKVQLYDENDFQDYEIENKDDTKKITYFGKNKNHNQMVKESQSNKFLQSISQEDGEDFFMKKQTFKIDSNSDLQETRFIKENINVNKYQNGVYDEQQYAQNKIVASVSNHNLKLNSKKGLPPLYPSSSLSPLSNYDSSNPSNQNSDCKTIDRVIKRNNSQHQHKLNIHQQQQQTSQSNYPNLIHQQIQQLTDQSEALMYELRKTGNQDKQIKKKIIRISQKIRQLKMDKSVKDENNDKYTSLQNIIQKQ